MPGIQSHFNSPLPVLAHGAGGFLGFKKFIVYMAQRKESRLR
ncbi:MAG: hypothetical protein UV92_C0012G0017 [Parcubacteria group bacterium GW2011_GWA1_43_27]|nr:MAG: hypothetical protein UV47_C0025G0008 [Parcubacteria group bacterium GW2011_GWA2_42_80]KKS91974.1 MAG: hypothetical protein UV69_C0041G0011 [Parcubacteria group bacterium GW2011_GWE2_43_12]KKT13919.1 MAG: hypothetical protein UV92_C0012G0017 [Parcubacteria group bacterium GW2011_GWA1_43_27]